MHKDLARTNQRDKRIKVVTAKRAGKKIRKISRAYWVHPKSIPRMVKTSNKRKSDNRRKGFGRRPPLLKGKKQK